LLKKFAHSRNFLTEFARSIEKLLTVKNLAGLDGSTRWLNVSHQANRSTAGAHLQWSQSKPLERAGPDHPVKEPTVNQPTVNQLTVNQPL
jgi:hypothetical protein